MRPLTLAMTAFGPFAGTETIDFRRLGENPLFLINGPTGAGKTSILDAICFALYGETTGGERQGAEMRSHHAAPELLTEISFEFELAGKQYRIRRVPDQERPKARGEGTTQHKAEAQLAELGADGSARNLVPRKVGEANQRVMELIGLDADQFRQVMVLPQGRFRELLLAPSQEREAIFQQLFQTHVYARLERALKDGANALSAEVERLGERSRGLLEGCGLASTDALATALHELLAQIAVAGAARDAALAQHGEAQLALEAARLLEQRFVAHDGARKALERIVAEESLRAEERSRARGAAAARTLAPHHESVAQRAAEHERASGRWREAEAALARARDASGLAEAAWREATAQEPELLRLRDEMVRLRALEPVAIELQHGERLLRERRAERARADAAQEAARGAHEAAAKALADVDARIAGLRQRMEALAEAPLARERCTARLLVRRRQEELTATLEDLRVAGDTAARRLEDAALAQRRAAESLRALRQAWQAGQAVVLARELRHGAPCPVCGSAEHPAPAVGAQEVPAPDTLDRALELDELAREALEAARIERVRIDEAIAAQEATLARLREELGDHAGEPLAALEQQAAALAANVQAHDLAQAELRDAERARADCIERVTRLASDRDSMRLAAHTAERAEGEAAVAFATQQRQLPEALRVPGAVAEALRTAMAGAERLGRELGAARSRQQEAGNGLAGAQVEAAGRLDEMQRAAALLQETEAAWQQLLAASPFADTAAFREALLEPGELQRLEQEIRDRENALLLARRALEDAAGAIAGAERPLLPALEQAELVARRARDAAVGDVRVLGERRATLERTQHALAQLLAEQAALEAEYAVLGRLARIANGGNAHNLSLQRFVLSVLLDEVLVEAGHRLRLMSRGRYQLSRREEVRDARSKSGLELDVEDAYTGRVRPVATLSGGESFMAALALALGLSDVVQAHSGGIRLDTLFIDEGFGSLDADALDLAIRTLIDLQASGRMVGIISHVPELKQQMDVQIVVVPGASGSHLRLVAP